MTCRNLMPWKDLHLHRQKRHFPSTQSKSTGVQAACGGRNPVLLPQIASSFKLPHSRKFSSITWNASMLMQTGRVPRIPSIPESSTLPPVLHSSPPSSELSGQPELLPFSWSQIYQLPPAWSHQSADQQDWPGVAVSGDPGAVPCLACQLISWSMRWESRGYVLVAGPPELQFIWPYHNAVVPCPMPSLSQLHLLVADAHVASARDSLSAMGAGKAKDFSLAGEITFEMTLLLSC